MKLGAASIFVELADGVITVRHGTDDVVLHRVEAHEDMWGDMFSAMCAVLYRTEVK